MTVLKIVPRSQWGAAEPERRTFRPIKSLEGVVVHWFGKPTAAKRHSGCARLLQSVQRGHLNHPTENYSDIAYGHGVCPHGYVYELRGFGVQVGANGTTDANERYGAIVYMAGEGDPLTVVARAALGDLIRLYRQKGAGPKVLPHRAITGSECPGLALRRWVTRREYNSPRFVIRYRNGIPYVEPEGTP